MSPTTKTESSSVMSIPKILELGYVKFCIDWNMVNYLVGVAIRIIKINVLNILYILIMFMGIVIYNIELIIEK